MDIEMTKVMQWFHFTFFLNPFLTFMYSHFVKGSNPLLSGPKGLSKVPTQSSKNVFPRDQNRGSTMFTATFTGVWPYSASL